MLEDISEVFVVDNKEINIKRLTPDDALCYIKFCKKIAEETTHTLHYKGECISEKQIKDRLQYSVETPWHLELGGFYQNQLISHLWCSKPNPYHPFEQHTLQFAIKILKQFWRIGLGTKLLHIMEDFGTKLLHIMEDFGKKIEIKRIQAQVRAMNFIGIDFKKKMDI